MSKELDKLHVVAVRQFRIDPYTGKPLPWNDAWGYGKPHKIWENMTVEEREEARRRKA